MRRGLPRPYLSCSSIAKGPKGAEDGKKSLYGPSAELDTGTGENNAESQLGFTVDPSPFAGCLRRCPGSSEPFKPGG